MQPDPRQLRRLPWLPSVRRVRPGAIPQAPGLPGSVGGLLPPLRLQLKLSGPPAWLSEKHRLELARQHARRRVLVAALASVGIASLVASSALPVAAANSTAGAASRPQLGGAADPQLVGYAAAMVPDNAGKGRGQLPGTTGPGGGPTTTTTTTTPTVNYSDITDLGIPAVAVQAYRTAAVTMAHADPTCRIDWTLIAGIGRIESDHGQYGGRRPAADGSVLPPILGIPLDGRLGVALIRDTDGGRLDGDTTYDRAVGPMQFIPGTWAEFPSADGNGDGVADPNNLYDAALAAASYLCSGPGDLSTQAGARSAVYRYNHSDSYVAAVLGYAAAYAAGVHPAGPAPVPAGPAPVVPTAPVTDPAHPTAPPSTSAPTATRPTTTAPTTTAPTTTPPTTAPPTTAPPTTTAPPPTTAPPTTSPPTTSPTDPTDPTTPTTTPTMPTDPSSPPSSGSSSTESTGGNSAPPSSGSSSTGSTGSGSAEPSSQSSAAGGSAQPSP